MRARTGLWEPRAGNDPGPPGPHWAVPPRGASGAVAPYSFNTLNSIMSGDSARMASRAPGGVALSRPEAPLRFLGVNAVAPRGERLVVQLRGRPLGSRQRDDQRNEKAPEHRRPCSTTTQRRALPGEKRRTPPRRLNTVCQIPTGDQQNMVRGQAVSQRASVAVTPSFGQ